MHVDFYGLQFDTPNVTFYLWSPWRASSLENGAPLRGALHHALPGVEAVEKEADEIRLHIREQQDVEGRDAQSLPGSSSRLENTGGGRAGPRTPLRLARYGCWKATPTTTATTTPANPPASGATCSSASNAATSRTPRSSRPSISIRSACAFGRTRKRREPIATALRMPVRRQAARRPRPTGHSRRAVRQRRAQP